MMRRKYKLAYTGLRANSIINFDYTHNYFIVAGNSQAQAGKDLPACALQFKTKTYRALFYDNSFGLFFPEEYSNRHTTEIKFFSQLVFKIILIRRFNIIRVVCKKRE